MLQVGPDPLLLEPLVVVVQPRHERAGQRHVDVHRRRNQARDRAHQVPDPDERADCGDNRQVATALVSDVLVEHALEIADEILDDDLRLAGIVDAQARADE